MRMLAIAALAAAGVPAAAAAQEPGDPAVEAQRAAIRKLYDDNRIANNIPGTVVAVVSGGKLVLFEGLGTRDPATGAPVDARTRFRIASMSKAFTALAILHLRDEGKLSLDDKVARLVPETAGWTLPTRDSRAITVRDLLHHTAGFVEDNPWGDRQQVLSEPEFDAVMRGGMAFANAPGLGMEYSNYGYALLGRIVSNVSGKRYQDYIRETIMLPLGMTETGYDIAKSPAASRAIGYRWQDGKWLREPDLRDGAFGAMGGVETTAADYARWIAFLLSAWPARDEPEAVPVRRSTVRDMIAVAVPTGGRDRPKDLGPPCRQATAYAAGLNVISDCELGRVVTHSGGYPGYGSNMLILPDAGVGIFTFNNRTYAGQSMSQWKAMLELRRAGAIPDRGQPVAPSLAQAYEFARKVWQSGDPSAAPLANNVVPDRDLARRKAAIAELKAKVGSCAMSEPVIPVSPLEGTFTWACLAGKVTGRVQRAPLARPELQVIDFFEAKD